MKPQALLIALVVVAVLAALPHAESAEGSSNPAPWPCCDNCGVCNRKFPPECFCSDVSTAGCHPKCKNCEKTTGNDGRPVYQCKDMITNFCLRRCTPAAEQGEASSGI